MDTKVTGETLRMLLCRLEAGMILSVPDAWLETTFPGPRVARAKLVEDIARQYHCILRDDMQGVRFERVGFPATG
jgi:hypothetical protein